MSVIEAASVSLKTMADGTLRIAFDVEPAHAQAAFALFGAPGTPAALAALRTGHAAKSDAPAAPEKPKGGALARLAGMWCNDAHFHDWLSGPRGFLVEDAEEAAQFIRSECGVESRAELDTNEAAAERFHARIRTPYRDYLESIGANA